MIVKMDAGIQFGLGDWWAFGEARRSYGERAKIVRETAEKLRYDLKSLMQLGYVARRVAPSLRNELLYWSHHKEVAPLDPEDQKKWLDKAVRHNWTVRDLHEKLHEREVIHMARDPNDPGHEKAAQYWGEDFLAEASRTNRKLFPRWDDAKLDRVGEKTLASLVDAAGGAAVFWAETAKQLTQYQQTRLAAGKDFKPRVPDFVDKRLVDIEVKFEASVDEPPYEEELDDADAGNEDNQPRVDTNDVEAPKPSSRKVKRSRTTKSRKRERLNVKPVKQKRPKKAA
jgi:hypothetical protein